MEVSGVYTLPEAQIDRFLFKLLVDYPSYEEEKRILDQNVTVRRFEDFPLKNVLSPEKILDLQKLVKNVFTSEAIEEYIVKIVKETRNKVFEFSKYISYGASPRASIALHIAAKAEALMNGRDYVTPEDVRTVVYPVLRHRIILNYEAEAENINSEDIITGILDTVEVP